VIHAPDRVNFLIGGVQKGGTTALYEHLKRDLSVAVAEVKEAHFFDDETVQWDAPDYSAYHALFGSMDARPRGEATPIYLYWPGALERIAAYNPHMRLIFIFRDPVERAWSHWKMERQRDYDDAPFSWAIREGRKRVVDDPDSPGFHRVFSYVERGFYGAQLAHALTLFPRQQILTLRSDQLEKNPSGVLGQVAAHLGLPEPPPGTLPLKANVGVQGIADAVIGDDDVKYLARLYDADLRRFSALSALDVADWLADHPRKTNLNR
jgi:hypothetical protein